MTSKKKISAFAWIFLGILFVFSALTKGVDVFAFSAKIREYSESFGFEMPPTLYGLAAVMVIGFELLLGFLILNGIIKKIAYYASVLFLLLFTILTFVVAVRDDVFDCGCFGSFMSMTPWESFFKNVVLLLVAIIAYPQLKLIGKRNCISLIPFTLLTLIFCVSITYTQPLIDSNYYIKGSRFVMNNGGDVGVLDIEFLNDDKFFRESDFLVVRKLNDLANNDLLRLIRSLSVEHGTQPVVLTSTIPGEINESLFSYANVGLVDDIDISKLISTNLGVIQVQDEHIKNKWQQDFMKVQTYTPSNNGIDLTYIINIMIWVIIISTFVLSIIKTIKRECRKTHQRVGDL